ncbi:hypothetical protein ACJJTC_008630 [Scirpophaga incertulas]
MHCYVMVSRGADMRGVQPPHYISGWCTAATHYTFRHHQFTPAFVTLHQLEQQSVRLISYLASVRTATGMNEIWARILPVEHVIKVGMNEPSPARRPATFVNEIPAGACRRATTHDQTSQSRRCSKRRHSSATWQFKNLTC